jgi:hypothetical protein
MIVFAQWFIRRVWFRFYWFLVVIVDDHDFMQVFSLVMIALLGFIHIIHISIQFVWFLIYFNWFFIINRTITYSHKQTLFHFHY